MNPQLKKFALTAIDECLEKKTLASLKILIPLLNTHDSEVHGLALQAAIEILKVNLMNSYEKMDASIRKGLIHLLNKVSPSITQTLKDEVYSADVPRRVRAIQILGLVQSTGEMEGFLKDLLSDSDETIRAATIASMAEYIGTNQLEVLLSLLNDPNERVRANTVEALGKSGNENLIGILLRHKNEKNNRIRANVLKALWHLGYSEIEKHITEMLNHDEKNMHLSAIWLIGEIARENSKFIPLILNIENKDDAETRARITETLLKLDSELAASYLEKLYAPKTTPA